MRVIEHYDRKRNESVIAHSGTRVRTGVLPSVAGVVFAFNKDYWFSENSQLFELNF